MQIKFVAGFAPIVPDPAASLAFYRDALGLPLPDGDYPSTDALPGAKHFGLWPLAEVATSCFGTATWPSDLPVPQAALEFDVADADAVASAAAELEAKGYRLLVAAKTEPWGQTVARLLSPEGLLVGVTYTPWQHDGA
jgi:catechol 2,3-dioxygenase-like lactoylglutathione lyase family enzyme